MMPEVGGTVRLECPFDSRTFNVAGGEIIERDRTSDTLVLRTLKGREVVLTAN